MKFAQQLLLVCLGCAALGCGQKGPLVMPDQQKHKRTLPTAPGAAKPPSSTSPAPQNGGTAVGSATPAPPQSTPPSSATPPPADSTGR